MKANWARYWRHLEVEYVHDPSSSIRSLAAKYGVSFGSIAKYSAKHRWTEKRREFQEQLELDSLAAHRRHIHKLRAEYAPQIIAATVKAYLAVMERIHIDETTGIVRPDSERDATSRDLVIQMMQRLLGMHDEQIDIQRKLLAAAKPGTDEAKGAVEAVTVGELSTQAIETYGFAKIKKDDPEAQAEEGDEDEIEAPPLADEPEEPSSFAHPSMAEPLVAAAGEPEP